MKTTRQILNAIWKQGFKIVDGEVLSKNGKQTLGGITFSYPHGRVSRLEEGIRYTCEDTINGQVVRWTDDRLPEEGKPSYKVVRRVMIHNHLANIIWATNKG